MTTPQDPRSIDAIIDSLDGGPAFPQPQGKDDEAARIAAAAAVAAPAPAGVREEIDFEVEDILAFVANWPSWTRSKRAEVLAALKKSYLKVKR